MKAAWYQRGAKVLRPPKVRAAALAIVRVKRERAELVEARRKQRKAELARLAHERKAVVEA